MAMVKQKGNRKVSAFVRNSIGSPQTSSPHGAPMLKLPGHARYAYSPIVERPDYSWPRGKRRRTSMQHPEPSLRLMRCSDRIGAALITRTRERRVIRDLVLKPQNQRYARLTLTSRQSNRSE
jgi:hypothetical protein